MVFLMKNGGALTLTACLVAVAAIATSPGPAQAHKTRLCVAPPSGFVNSSCFGTITAALKHAHSGDSIEIAAGTYVENIHIGKNSKKGEKISLTITGSVSGSTIIDGGGNGTVVSIFPQAVVTLFAVTIQNGSASGITVRDATLALSNSVVSNNQAAPTMPGTAGTGGGIDFEVSNHPPKRTPQLGIDQCMISGNSTVAQGGGVAIGGGTASIFNSTISGNSAINNNGGGMYTAGQTTIANSTISGNQATGDPGISGEPQGGGIFYTGPLVLNNVTIANNSAIGFNGKGGGIFSLSSAATVSNTIIAANSANFQFDCGGNLNSQGHNLIQNNDCGITGDTTTNIIGEDAMLGPLQLNAPGTTKTQALMMGSPAIGTGDPGANDSSGPGPQCLGIDQHGVIRPTNACDIGAYQTSM